MSRTPVNFDSISMKDKICMEYFIENLFKEYEVRKLNPRIKPIYVFYGDSSFPITTIQFSDNLVLYYEPMCPSWSKESNEEILSNYK